MRFFFHSLGIFFILLFSTRCAHYPQKVDPKHKALLYVQAANGALMEKDALSALQFLAKAEKLDSSLAEIYHSRALAFYLQKDRLRAQKAIKKALILAPKQPSVLLTAGKFLLDQGKDLQAEKLLKQAALNPLFQERYKAYTNLGLLYWKQKRFTLAKQHFRHATELVPQSSCVAFFYLGKLAEREKNLFKALRFYQRASEHFCANYEQAHQAQVHIYLALKKFQRAKKKLLSILEQFSQRPLSKWAAQTLEALP